ncbi:hypothetical protein B0H63DRAFT_449282 [Podospora didyma]|uniref:Uncharacterized protein n=1 Tax=Podospora didyma TaxID=330526 RepID=A0AAE0TZF4_9PEZI|nr:hypothetical protein B0H63DRAFT_449282 [Podospora didyma]
MNMMLFSGLISISLLALPCLSQSPGPDWPNCASVSRSGPWGYEFYRFRFEPFMPGREDAQDAVFHLDAENSADGSRVVCHLSANVSSSNASNNSAGVVLDSRIISGCETYWTEDRYDEQFTNETHHAKTAGLVSFDTQSGELGIEQEWGCRESDGRISQFSGIAKEKINMRCVGGREGERTTCEPVIIGGDAPQTFLFGRPTARSTEPAVPAKPPTSVVNCSTATPTWQILSMYFSPPGPWPKSASFPSTGLRIELRNLADESRTLCYLNEDNVAAYEDGVLLRNNGTSLGVTSENHNQIQGCETGRWYDVSGSDRREWRWMQVPEVTFHTKSHVLSIRQTWMCGQGGNVAVAGYAEQVLDMDCKDTGVEYVPVQCEPSRMVFSSVSGPVLLGPGKAEAVKD